MLINDLRTIGNNMLLFRKRQGLTQAELAERAGLSDRTYADIERGTVNMRVQTLLKICEALDVLPNDLLSCETDGEEVNLAQTVGRLDRYPASNQQTALKLLNVYLDSLREKEMG